MKLENRVRDLTPLQASFLELVYEGVAQGVANAQ